MYKSVGFFTYRRPSKILKNNLVVIARGFAPVKTGNLRYNAIYARDTSYGFDIVWDDSLAHYMKYVNEGAGVITAKKARNLNFVDKGVSACLLYLNEYEKRTYKYKNKNFYDDLYTMRDAYSPQPNVNDDNERKIFEPVSTVWRDFLNKCGIKREAGLQSFYALRQDILENNKSIRTPTSSEEKRNKFSTAGIIKMLKVAEKELRISQGNFDDEDGD